MDARGHSAWRDKKQTNYSYNDIGGNLKESSGKGKVEMVLACAENLRREDD